MRMSRKLVSLSMSGAIMLGLAGAALAAPAVATTNVNVRSGPSSGYGQVDTLRRNELVEVTGCRSGWCYVEKPGADGWVSARYLQPVRQQSSKPSVSFSFNFGTTPNYREHHYRHDDRRHRYEDRRDRHDRHGRWDDHRRDDRRN